MFKQIIAHFKLSWKLGAPITHNRLTELGFEFMYPFYMLESLAIEFDISKKQYFYVDGNGDQHRIKIMRDVGRLIYGITEYGK